MTLRMGDATAANLLPAGLDVAAGYVDGYRTDYQDIVTAFPGLKHLAIDAGHVDIEMSTPFDCLDVERYAFTPADFPKFLSLWHRLNTRLPVGYIQTSNAASLVIAAQAPRTSYLLWTAHYTNTAHVCTSAHCWPSSPIPWEADGTQWTDHGGVWDESLLNDNFFDPPPAPTPVKEHEMVMIRDSKGNIATFTGSHKTSVLHPDNVAALQSAGVPLVNVTDDFYNAIPCST